MKSIIALLLGVIFFAGGLFPHTDIEEVYKIPSLIHHYFEHEQNTTEDSGFWHFLQLHYGIGSKHTNKHQGDSKLPMFHHHCVGLMFVLPKMIAFAQAPEPSVLLSCRYSFYRNTYAYLFSVSPLRPPQS